jgi:hypothetical protein
MILDLLIKDESGETVGKLVLLPKEFKTGSKGFFVQDKLTVAGKRYQVQCQLVEIGSKDAGANADKAETKPGA